MAACPIAGMPLFFVTLKTKSDTDYVTYRPVERSLSVFAHRIRIAR
jgi:hypothetical protein